MKTLTLLLSAIIVAGLLSAGCDSATDNGAGVTQNSEVMTVAPNQAFLLDGGFIPPEFVAQICLSDNGTMKVDEDGKITIKCFDPKGQYKYDGKGKVECKGLDEAVFEIYCTPFCPE